MPDSLVAGQAKAPLHWLHGYNERVPGFLRITVTSTELRAEYFTVPFTGSVPATPFDAVTLNYQTGTITGEMNPGTSGAAP
jgi:hypothetical protein